MSRFPFSVLCTVARMKAIKSGTGQSNPIIVRFLFVYFFVVVEQNIFNRPKKKSKKKNRKQKEDSSGIKKEKSFTFVLFVLRVCARVVSFLVVAHVVGIYCVRLVSVQSLVFIFEPSTNAGSVPAAANSPHIRNHPSLVVFFYLFFLFFFSLFLFHFTRSPILFFFFLSCCVVERQSRKKLGSGDTASSSTKNSSSFFVLF